jgi:lysophospholipase L1-like esterase
MKVCSPIARILAFILFVAAPVFAGNEKNYRYLALGDSIAFGYDPTVDPRSGEYHGYPYEVAKIQKLWNNKKTTNASCPGQTSRSFLFGGEDNGCEEFKTSFGLHTSYSGTQTDFAVAQLKSNRHINTVSLSIGGNDLLLLEKKCKNPDRSAFEQCVQSELPDVLALYGQHLTQILSDIRYRANYQGTLILVTAHSPSADPLFVYAVGLFREVMMQAGSGFAAKIADAFTGFLIASQPSHGDPCAAGLLIRLPAGGCDVHPSETGRKLIADTVISVLP